MAVTRRDQGLEAVRGWAAISVLFYHATLAFAPRLNGLYDAAPSSMFGTPLYALVNGGAAVVLFFVLSGYVLTKAVRHAASPARIGALVLRRWPRLAGPVLVVNIFAAILLAAGVNFATQAGALSGSSWFPKQYPGAADGMAAMVAAAREGMWGSFLFGEKLFNSNLWTMKLEFFGSFIVFALAAACIWKPNLRRWFFVYALCLSFVVDMFYPAFVVGSALAFVDRPVHISRFALVPLGLMTIYLIGYHEPLFNGPIAQDWYGWLRPVANASDPLIVRVSLHVLAAVVIILMICIHR